MTNFLFLNWDRCDDLNFLFLISYNICSLHNSSVFNVITVLVFSRVLFFEYANQENIVSQHWHFTHGLEPVRSSKFLNPFVENTLNYFSKELRC